MWSALRRWATSKPRAGWLRVIAPTASGSKANFPWNDGYGADCVEKVACHDDSPLIHFSK
jgi:hypothetical protein